MAISCSYQEALSKLRAICPVKPMANFFDTPFPKSIMVAFRAPLLRKNLLCLKRTGRALMVLKSRFTPTILLT